MAYSSDDSVTLQVGSLLSLNEKENSTSEDSLAGPGHVASSATWSTKDTSHSIARVAMLVL